LAADTEYIASVVDQIDGQVLLVGHSYAGAIISNVVAKARNVVGLVFVAAFAPDDGEGPGDVAARSKDAILGPALLQRNYPIGSDGTTGVEFVVDPERFHEVFAGDLPADRAAVLAATQRPVARGRLQREGRTARLEDGAVLGRGRHRRQGGGHGHRAHDGAARGR
jgi:pimeloyl-ACP methyl ester carboxylesterase